MHDDGAGLAVVQQVAQLLGHVAVVDVEGRHPGLQRPEHRLEVLVAVVQVDRQVVLAALVPGEVGALGVHAEALLDQVVGQPACPFGDVRPRVPAITEHQAVGIGSRRRDGLVDLGQAELRRARVGGIAHV